MRRIVGFIAATVAVWLAKDYGYDWEPFAAVQFIILSMESKNGRD